MRINAGQRPTRATLIRPKPIPLQYSDGSYLATVIACLGYSLVLTTSAELQGQTVDTSEVGREFNDEILVQSVEELDRYMEMDRLVPSYQNAVTIAGLECRIKLTLAYLIPLDIRRFLSYTRCVSPFGLTCARLR